MDEPVIFHLRWADASDAEIVATMVHRLLIEISDRTASTAFYVDQAASAQTARRWLELGHYQALLAYEDEQPLGVATIVQSYALYAGGAIGVIQEFFVAKQARSSGLGTLMLERIGELARRRGWQALELCTPPLPEFDRALSFYQHHDFKPVGGRKMRRSL